MNFLINIIAKGLTKATYNYIAFICCGLTGVLAFAAIAGWLTHTLFLASLSNELIPMAPSTAVCFLTTALVISLNASRYCEKKLLYLSTALLLTVALFCGIVFLQFAAKLPIDIESILLQKSDFKAGIPLGRMSPLTSAALLFATFATLLLTDFFKAAQKVRDLGSMLGLTIGFIGFAIFLGYVYGSSVIYQNNFIPVAVTTSLAFILIGAGIMAEAGPESLPSRWFQGESNHARLLRLFAPVLLLSMAINGAADIFAINTIKNAGLAIAFSTVTFFILLCTVLIGISHYVSRLLDKSMKAQRDSELRFRAVFEQAAVGVAQVEVGTSRFVTLNKKYCDIVGYSQEEMETLTFSQITHPDDLQTDLANAQLMQGGKIRVYLREKRYIHKNGSIVWVKLTVSPMWAIGEHPDYNIAVVEDITERKLIEEALRTSHEELGKAYNDLKSAQVRVLHQEKMASIGQLAAGVAHEINNPIGFISSNLNSLRRYTDKIAAFSRMQNEAIEKIPTNGDGQIEKILEEIREQKKSIKFDYIVDDLGNIIDESLDGADRVRKIVRDLKSFSRSDDSEFTSADINAGIESTINIVWNELKYKATLEKEFGVIPPTRCNIGQLNQVFMNILVNASHAIPTQGTITVKTRSADGNIYVAIADTGTGIPDETLGKIFDPFFTTKEVGKGTGLGLSIAYDIIKKHKGEIKVDSEVGKGTSFTISIPIVED